MKKLFLILTLVAFMGLAAAPMAFAEGLNPSLENLLNHFYEKKGEAVPQQGEMWLIDLLTNAYGMGWGTVLVFTNYDPTTRIRIQGFVVPKNAFPGEELFVDFWLNPYEVKYLDLNATGLGNTNGWGMFICGTTIFGHGALIYNTSSMTGMVWEQGWSWLL